MLAHIQESRARDQEGIIRAFEAGEIEGVSRPVRRIDTPLSYVFLAGQRAYKLKRAVQLPFIDFRDARERRAACEAELSVNRRFGSSLYQEVAGIAKTRDGYTLTGNDSALDWVVVMQRFDDGQRFDVMARRGLLSIEHVEFATARIAQIHESASSVRTSGHTADYRAIIRELRRTEDATAAEQHLSTGDERLYLELDHELTRLGPLIEERRESGKVRRGHGDVHLSNLCLYKGEPVLFDALEFDEKLATTDTLYDLAFFLMDLRRFGLDREANAAMNHYWDISRETECSLALLPFFMALRAAVRMTVAVAAGDFTEASSYRSLGLKLLRRFASRTIAIGGLSGSGKSSVAREIAHLMPGVVGARVIRSDILRKRAFGVRLNDPVANDNYTPARRSEVYRDVMAHARSASRAGASVVVDATFEREEVRETLETILPAAHRVWLDAPLAIRLDRVNSRRLDASDANAEVACAQVDPARLEPGWRRVDASGPLSDVTRQVLELLE